jgi:nitroimidazol reductase NimA-like FMN-containing flavoprotein (pyridoxamine 5'-phosphate oxidase superfamily)
MMLESIEKIIRSNDLAVLATCVDNRPHCSLMAYVPHEDCRIVYMLTNKDSRKFRNISANSKVSLMVDNRLDDQVSRPDIKALTIGGTCSPAALEDQERIKKFLLQSHPQLETLSRLENTIAIEVRAESFLLLDGVNEAFFIDISR